MKTKGINNNNQFSQFLKDNNLKFDSQERKEFTLKSMLVSCFCYGGIDKTSWNFERYIKEHIAILGEELFWEVYEDQKNFLEKCEVKSNVYEDSEGCSYNSLIIN